MWYKKRPLIIKYSKRETANSSDNAIENYSVTVFGQDRSRLESFVEEISTFRKIEEGRLLVYTQNNGGWLWSSKRKRTFDTVYMPEKQKKDILNYITNFNKNEAWYNIRGIPWRLGISLEGPPGTGKTTIATALASWFDRPLYSLNLSTVGGDEALQKAFLSVDRDGIILIEDIDSYGVAQKRSETFEPEMVPAPENESELKKAAEAGSPIAQTKQQKSYGVTLSGLLNAIDGVAATEGRILIMTTNHPEKLDPALVRAGRIDRRIFIGKLGMPEVEAMFRCFYPEATPTQMETLKGYAKLVNLTAANWQGLFIQHHDSLETLIEGFETSTRIWNQAVAREESAAE